MSDYWENIFGTRPREPHDDANERPSNDDLANPAKYSALTEIPYIPPSQNNP